MAFVFVSGDLALDFVGTLKWRRDAPEEQLTAPAEAARWAVAAGVLTEPPQVSPAEFTQLLDLREAVYRLVRASLCGQPWPAADVDTVNALADGPAPRVTLSTTGLVRRGSGAAVAAVISRAAADLLAQCGELRLKECERERCTRLFVDRSRTGNRRWCGMAECGNRVKAAHYRARKAGAGTTTAWEPANG
ncbi:CGNR zinc finger domain-containing protein [Goodfellowiella coeruleoviolacea]|uniref:Conserved protein containing a Zn-ribbon-like motif, possibly RNA-binding n=1 Tax=Goodfellowiella coeruleoviolacea TaxID=334858 RepID=A0AAE3GHH7_9PSEU|nr:ABATE domain-containing protein [Goodfellowiella coeruleoviolacea]MCP2167457.1 Conserved protein containing a Zn-ribbon-like motif, possibly RNA-binding [Goodfellowiella coeruleoviolacea]